MVSTPFVFFINYAHPFFFLNVVTSAAHPEAGSKSTAQLKKLFAEHTPKLKPSKMRLGK